jgi:hypothetical protein
MNKRIPVYLHLPQQILWFDVQEVGLIILFYLMGVTFGGVAWFFIVIGPALTIPIKRKKPRGWIFHQFISFGYQQLQLYPKDTEKKFLE